MSTLGARASLALGEARELMVLSRRRLGEGDVGAALQLHSGAWWKVGAAAVLGNYVKDSMLNERVRLLAEELGGDSRRFEDLAGRACPAGSRT